MKANGEESSLEAIYLVGVSLHPDAAGSRLYTLLLMHEDARGGRDRPLTDAHGYILWFPEPGSAARAVALGDAGFRKHGAAPADVAATYDFASLFWTVSEGSASSGGTVDALNLLLDLVDATSFPFPVAYRRDLFALADHLTFSTDIEAFFAGDADARTRLMDAITWCVGAVTIKSTIMGDPAPGARAARPDPEP
jgi:hypothetical protein